jgi:uncharacterized protein YecT (DUF1311 family)
MRVGDDRGPLSAQFFFLAVLRAAFVLGLACALFSPQRAGAETLGELYAKLHVDCSHQETSLEGKICADHDLTIADGELDMLVAAMLKKYGKTDAGLLKSAQDRWSQFRTAECTFETASTTGGSIHFQMVDLCLAKLARARTRDLKAQRDCDLDHDASCNPPD